MKMSIKERMVFNALLPQSGDLLMQSLVKDLTNKIKLTPDENKKLNFRQEGPNLRWDEKNAKDVDFKFSEFELSFLKEQVERLNTSKQVNQDNLSLLLKIKNIILTKK